MQTSESAVIQKIRKLDEERVYSTNVSFPVVVGEKQYQCKLLSAKGELVATVQFAASDPFEAANICMDARNWMTMGRS